MNECFVWLWYLRTCLSFSCSSSSLKVGTFRDLEEEEEKDMAERREILCGIGRREAEVSLDEIGFIITEQTSSSSYKSISVHLRHVSGNKWFSSKDSYHKPGLLYRILNRVVRIDHLKTLNQLPTEFIFSVKKKNFFSQ